MTLRDVIKDLCKGHGISVNKLETDLGFAKGYISKLDKSTPNSNKLRQISEYFGVSLDYLMTGDEKDEEKTYYINDDTREIAQKVFENKELRLLFDAAKDANPEDIETTYNMLLALKRKEKSEI